jgi:hypothetical protein
MVAEREPTLTERLLKHAGTITDLPSDMAEQHDPYIHGTPKTTVFAVTTAPPLRSWGALERKSAWGRRI